MQVLRSCDMCEEKKDSERDAIMQVFEFNVKKRKTMQVFEFNVKKRKERLERGDKFAHSY